MAKSLTYKPAIVIPAYKRGRSLLRLLQSVNEAWFPDQNVQLIISIDGNPDPEAVRVAKDFTFNSGTVDIVEHRENIGLYNHILECADYAETFGSIIVLEDDLVVAPSFYEYACRALDFYDKSEDISGIALYSQRFNETSLLPFEPMENEWPAYFMQLGCSWGQAWTHKQWCDFRKWHSDKGSAGLSHNPKIPNNIRDWASTSWKKHYNHYLIEQDKYIVYPYRSFTTNCTDTIGAHMKYLLNTFQVPLNMSGRLGAGFQFPDFEDRSIRYDAFMELKSNIIEEWSGLELDDLEMDLYGSKPVELIRKKKYVITAKNGKNPIRSFPLSFRPVELNVKYETDQSSDSFFHLFRTKDLKPEDSLSNSLYFQLAEYFLYIPIDSRKFAFIYFNEFLKKTLKRIKNRIRKK